MWDKFDCRLKQFGNADQRETHLFKINCKRTYNKYRLVSDEYKEFSDNNNQNDKILYFVFPLCKSSYTLQYRKLRFSILIENSDEVKQFSEKVFTYTKVPYKCL